jgi:hypothetical protein
LHAERDQAGAEEWDGERRGSGDSRGVRPFPFHLCNVAAHASVTALVYRLARQLAAARRRLPPAAASDPQAACGGQDAASWVTDLEAFLAALLFALHPVHTEAVAGIVGHAELLCAALSIPALLCYMAAAEGRVATVGAHWRLVAAAVLLGWAAALAKEIGITIVSCSSRGSRGAAAGGGRWRGLSSQQTAASHIWRFACLQPSAHHVGH